MEVARFRFQYFEESIRYPGFFMPLNNCFFFITRLVALYGISFAVYFCAL